MHGVGEDVFTRNRLVLLEVEEWWRSAEKADRSYILVNAEGGGCLLHGLTGKRQAEGEEFKTSPKGRFISKKKKE